MWQLLMICLLFEASASQISGNGNTTAVYGGDAHYRCALARPAGVLQVTWQRVFSDGSIENLATYSRRFGKEVNEPYVGKVILTEASLSSSSITLKNVTWKDESCYICSFNAYPEGSKRKQTCLTVQGISEVSTSHSVSSGHDKDDREVVFRCSATGRPAPTVEWDFSSGATSSDETQATAVTNSDLTFTSNRSITLKVPPGWKGHVDCVLNSGLEGQRQERIPFSSPDGREEEEEEEEEEEGKQLSQAGIALIVIAVIFIFSIVVAAVMTRKRLKGERRSDRIV